MIGHQIGSQSNTCEAPEGINPPDFRDPKVWKPIFFMVTRMTDGVSDLIEPSNYQTNGYGKVCLHRSKDLRN